MRGSSKEVSRPIVTNSLYWLPANVGALAATGTALLLPGSLRPEGASAATTREHDGLGICGRPMRHSLVLGAK